MGDRIHIAAKKTSTPLLKSKGARLLQRRSPEQIQPEIASLANEKQLSTSGQADLTSPFIPAPGHNFGQMAVWPAGSSSIQRKLASGQPGDSYEPEVDRMTKPASATEPESQQTHWLAAPTIAPVQRQAEQQKEEEDQIQAKPQPGQAPTVMPAKTRALMEPRFGHAGGVAIQRRVEMRDVGRGEQSGFARLPELVERLNAMSQGLTFSTSGRELRYAVREGGTLSGFDRQMIGFVDQDPVIPLRLTNRHGLLGDRVAGFHDRVEVDAWSSGYVDIDDLLASTDLGLQSTLVHFLRERSETSNYARRIGSPSLDTTQPGPAREFERAHSLGIEAEAQLLRDFFADPTIRFVPGAESGQIFRVYRNSRRDRIQTRVRSGRGAERGVDAVSIEVVTQDGVTHTEEEYRRILEEERTAQQVARERLGGATEHTEGGHGVPAP